MIVIMHFLMVLYYWIKYMIKRFYKWLQKVYYIKIFNFNLRQLPNQLRASIKFDRVIRAEKYIHRLRWNVLRMTPWRPWDTYVPPTKYFTWKVVLKDVWCSVYAMLQAEAFVMFYMYINY